MLTDNRPGRVFFDIQEAIDIFETRVSAMSNLDYDIDEILDTIITAINYEPHIEKHRAMMTQTYLSWSINDGPILSAAWNELYDAIIYLIRRTLSWDVRGMLGYYYDSHPGNQLILVRTPSTE